MMRSLFALAFVLIATVAQAVQPDEILDDPALEARAREISLARDLRLLVRERLLEGDSNEETVDYIVDRYGEYVLLKPTTGGWNWLLWAAGPLLFVFALLTGAVYIRGRSRAAAPAEAGLSEDEKARLEQILRD